MSHSVRRDTYEGGGGAENVNFRCGEKIDTHTGLILHSFSIEVFTPPHAPTKPTPCRHTPKPRPPMVANLEGVECRPLEIQDLAVHVQASVSQPEFREEVELTHLPSPPKAIAARVTPRRKRGNIHVRDYSAVHP